ncbi:AAA family ATPase [Oleiharenicola lentus]|uniref:AAA family ATPase n=1 Tax=Oleiharenicola lentus TaxID=2508720 RepID=UPI003F669E36
MTKGKHLPLASVQLRNFKAVRNSGVINLGPLTVFIGNNGSGKSSVIEGLEFLKTVALHGLEPALEGWHSFKHIWNQAVSHELPAMRNQDTKAAWAPQPMSFSITGHNGAKSFAATCELSESRSLGQVGFKSETLSRPRTFYRTRQGNDLVEQPGKDRDPKLTLAALDSSESILGRDGHIPFNAWAFLSLEPAMMGGPKKRSLQGLGRPLTKTGSNLAEYLLDFFQADADAFYDLLDTIRIVLPYARNLEPTILEDIIEKRVFMKFKEGSSQGDFDLPSWMLSTGTLRILALLAALRHPTRAPKLLVVDEIENGLDPRTIGMLISEIRSAVESGQTQVIVTTHSPYLLDQLTLSHLLLVERDPASGAPTFKRPAEDKVLVEWAKKFAPGALYSMGTMSKRGESDRGTAP